MSRFACDHPARGREPATRLWTGALVAGLLLLGAAARADIQKVPGGFLFTGTNSTVLLSDTNGAILSMATGGGAVATGGEAGLWSVAFGTNAFSSATGSLHAASFSSTSLTHAFSWSLPAPSNMLYLTYSNADLVVAVTLSNRADGVEMSASLAPRTTNVLLLTLPARVRFNPASVARFVAPSHTSDGVGMAYTPDFFEVQNEGTPASWNKIQGIGPGAYISLYGSGLSANEIYTPTSLTFTAAGAAWLGNALSSEYANASAVVHRPPATGQWDVVLIDSPRGPFFSGSHLPYIGGTTNSGWLMRLGGLIDPSRVEFALDVVVGAVEHLAQAAGGRTNVAVLSMARGPAIGESWPSEVPIYDWVNRLRASTNLAAQGIRVNELTSIAEMTNALAATNFLAILNPYGELVPGPLSGGIAATATNIGQYVVAGGSWFEVAGYSFYQWLQPELYYAIDLFYPPVFADFLQLETTNGNAAIYGVQPIQTTPANAWSTNAGELFVPGQLIWGGDAAGGYCQRAFGTYVASNQAWQSPKVRLSLGQTAAGALRDYAQANQLNRGLTNKVDATTLDKLRRSILIHYVHGGEETYGVATQLTAGISKLPSPSLIHFSQYLWGGFDKLYPDLLNPTNLAPAAHFGTIAEFTNFLAQARAGGHLTMPYTNPTFWSDPPGPTALAGGTGARQINLNGSYSFENYFGNGGYNVTPWHPAVRAASTNTLNDFTTTYPVDVLFQDQIGARTWQYDFNTNSPTPYAYMGGIIARAGEDSATMPVSTENGYDRLANYEAQFCGLAWGLVPTPNAPSWRRFLRDRYAPWTWNIFPVAQYIAHDKVLMNYNDLSASVATHEVIAWTLGLGYGTTYRLEATEIDTVSIRQWLLWVDRVQKSVISRYAGQGINAFSHTWGTNAVDPDNGVIAASYGPVDVVGNLGLQTVVTNGWTLPAHGYVATATGLRAAHYVPAGGTDPVAYVAETNAGGGVDFWIHSVGDRAAKIVLPPGYNGTARVQLDGYPAVQKTVTSDALTVSLGSSGTNAMLWHGTLSMTGTQAVYLVDFGRHDGQLLLPETNGFPTVSPDHNGNYWNNLGSVTNFVTNGTKVASLVTTANGASGVGVEITSGGWGANGIKNGGLVNPSPTLLGSLAVTNATMDYIFTTVSDTFKITGLDTARVYNLEFFGSRSNTATRVSKYTVGTNTATLTTSGTGIGDGGVNWNNNTTAVLRALAPNASGEIAVTVATNGGGFAYVNILKIEQVVPPPAAGPSILPGTTALNFAATNGGPNPASQTFGLTNAGVGTLNYTLATNAAWLSVSPVTGSLAAGSGEQITVTVNTAGLQPGTSNATITVNDPAATNSPQTISISLALAAASAPAIQVAPASLSFAGTNGGANPPAQSFALTNIGSATLNFAIATNANWLSVSPPTGSLAAAAGQAITVTVSSAGLSTGVSNATITVSDPAATNTPKTVAVSLTISAASSVAVMTQEVILVDFGNDLSFRGTNVANPDVNGRYWNSVYSGAYYADLVNQSNTASTVDLGFDAATGTDSFNGPGGGFDAAALGPLGVTNAVNDYYVNASFQLQGLVTSRTYRLTFFGSHKFSTDTTTVYTIHNDANYTQALRSVSLNVQVPGASALHNSNTVAVLTNLTPQANGRLYVKFEGDRGNEGYLNALMIEALATTTSAPPTASSTQAVYLVDFGRHDGQLLLPETNGFPTVSPDYNGNYWNNLGSVTNFATNGTKVANMANTTNGASGVGVELTSGGWGANGIKNGGLLTPSPALLGLLAVTNATMDYIFTTSSDTFKLTGLNTALVYNLEFFGTRSNSSTRVTTYTVGANAVTLTTSGSGIGAGGADWNNNTTAVLRALSPNASGEIAVTVAATTGGFGYLNILKVEQVYVPPSTSPAPAIAVSPAALTFSSTAGGANPASLGFGLTNTGTAALNYTIATNASWLSVVPVSGTLATGAGQQVTVSINNGGLQHGSSNATITITDPAAANSPQYVNVTLNIAATNPLLAVFGTSVAKGWNSSGFYANPQVYVDGGSWSNGYAALMTLLLQSQGGPAVTNVSEPGRDTGWGQTNFAARVIARSPTYVLLGFSLGNEGLSTSPDEVTSSNIVARFNANLWSLVGACRTNGFYPVISSVYPHGSYTTSHYAHLKRMHLAINSWNVPSLNLLTPVDDGAGKWLAGYTTDAAHPNDAGYAEFFYAFVPSLFDAIEAGKTNSPAFGSPTNYATLTQSAGVNAPLTFTPSNTVHSFTTAFRLRTSATGTVAAVRSGANYATLEVRAGQLVYVSRSGSETAIATNLANGAWHDVALSGRYALSNTAVYVNGAQAAVIPERFVPDEFILGGPGASGRAATPAQADLQRWCVYRAGWTADEALAQKNGSLQQSSMEIGAMLDDAAFTNGAPAANRAQSLSQALVNTPNLASSQAPAGSHPTILIDFGMTNGTYGALTDSPDTFGRYWNNAYCLTQAVPGTALFLPAGLVYADGGASTVGVLAAGSWGANGMFAGGGLMEPLSSLLGNLAVTNATKDYFYTSTSASLTLTNLDPSATYQLRYFGTRSNTTTRITRYLTTGGNGTFTNDLQTSGTGIGAGGYNGNNSNIVTVSGVTPDANRRIQVTLLTNSASAFAYINLLELTANRAPVASNDSFTRASGQAITLTNTQLTANDADPDGDALSFLGFGSLPSGATTNATTITLPGTNTAVSFTYTIGDGLGGVAAGTVTVSLASCPTITLSPAILAHGISNVTYSAQTITASGGTAPYTYAVTAGSLPAGLTLTSAGAITGTPTAATGTSTFTVTATDNNACTGSRSYTLEVRVRSFAVTPNAAVAPFTLDTNTANCVVSGGSLASTGNGITIPGGLLYPAPAGVYQNERWGASTYTFSGLTAGTEYAVRLHFAEIWYGPGNGGGGGIGSRVFNVTTNSGTWLANFDILAATTNAANTAVIRETTVTANGSGQIVIGFTVGSADNPKVSGIEILELAPCTAPAVQTVSGSTNLCSGGSASVTMGGSESGVSYQLYAGASLADTWNGDGSPKTWTVSPSGTTVYSVQAARAGGYCAATMSGSATVSVLAISTTSLPDAAANTAYSQTIAAAGGTPPYAFSVSSNSLPVGLYLTTGGSITGTPVALGATNFGITATDGAGCSATAIYSLSVTRTRLAVYGSSVAKGWNGGGSFTNGSYALGYAGRLTTFLDGSLYVTNVALAGENSSNAVVRFPARVVPAAPQYVLIGYSLGNEFLAGTTDPTSGTLTSNFLANIWNVVGLCRTNGYYPIVAGVYPHSGYTAGNYGYVKQAQLAINAWNVPSINLLGAVDDGFGRWATNVYSDAAHPNTEGHEEIFLAFVPSLFDAIAAGKTNRPAFGASTDFARLTADAGVDAPLTFTPSNTVHAFTMSFRMRTLSTGTIASVRSGGAYATLEVRSNQLVYVDRTGSETAIVMNLANGGWHDVALSAYYARSNTLVYVDGAPVASLTERFAPDQFILGGPAGSGRAATPALADLQNWCVYRAGWTEDEALAQKNGNLQQASMEIGTMLDDAAFTNGAPAANRAQSLSQAIVNTPNLAATQGAPLAAPSNVVSVVATGRTLQVNWSWGGSGQDGFVIQRRIAGSGPWADIATVGAGATNFTDSGLTWGVVYEYQVAAYEIAGFRGSYGGPAMALMVDSSHARVLVDFGPNDVTNGDSTGSPDVFGQHWNNMVGSAGASANDVALASMTQADGTPGGVGIFSGPSGWSCNGKLNGGLLAPSVGLLGRFAVTNATEDYFHTTTSGSLTLTNLNPAANYALRFFSTREFASTRATRYVTTGGNGVFTNDLQTSGTGIGAGGYNGNNNTIVSLSGVTPDGNGRIQVDVSALSGGFGYIGILELTANFAPIVTNDAFARYAGQALVVTAAQLLANDADPDGDPLVFAGFSALPAGATTNDTSITLPGTNATVNFTYTVRDEFGGSSSGVVMVVISAPPTLPAMMALAREGSDFRLTWSGTAGYAAQVQVSTGTAQGGYAEAFTNVGPPIVLLGSGDTVTNYLDPGIATNGPARYYRILLGP